MTITPLPKITQTGVLPYKKWCDKYQDYIDSIFDNIQAYLLHQICEGDRALADHVYDWRAMHKRLEQYLFTCSCNRYRSYEPIL